MRTISDKIYTVNQNTHFVFSNFYSENRVVYENMWKNTAEWGSTQMAIWRMRVTCWIPKVTNTHSQYVILIAFCSTIIAARTLLNITLYLLFLSCFLNFLQFLYVKIRHLLMNQAPSLISSRKQTGNTNVFNSLFTNTSHRTHI
jgi:hypothetical protein